MLTSLTTGISDYATRRAIQQLASKLNHDSKPTFAGLTINGESISDALITQWSTAYSWGDHAGLYDAIGTAEGEVSDHEATYDHTLLHNPVTLGTANGLTLNDQELSLPTTATPTLAGLTLTGMSGVVKTTAGVFSGSATLDDMADGTNYARVAATELSSGVYKNATTTVKGIASFSSTNFSVTDGAVSLATGGGLTHNDLGSLQGGTTGEYYHFTSADYAKIANWDTAYGWGDHAGLYDAAGTAAGEVGTHESTYDHSLLHSPVTLDALTGITLTGQQLSYTAGYAIPTTAKQAEWDSAYTHKTTEDAINGLVSCDGSGAYTAKVIGTDVQAYDADLTAIAALTPTDGNIIVGDGSTWVAESGATARTSLGLGTTDSPTFTKVTAYKENAGGTTEIWAYQNDSAQGGWARFVAHTGGFACTFEAIGNNHATYTSGARRRGAAVVHSSGAAGLSLCAGDSRGYISLYSGGDTTAHERMRITSAGKVGIGVTAPNEQLEVAGKIRSNTTFNLNGTDGVTQASSAGKVCDVTALAGGLATAQTQITYAADGTYNFDATSGKVSSITITNGRITAITTAE